MSHIVDEIIIEVDARPIDTVTVDAGIPGPQGNQGPPGATTFAGLTDAASADIPNVNTPLKGALVGLQGQLDDLPGQYIQALGEIVTLADTGSGFALSAENSGKLYRLTQNTPVSIVAGSGISGARIGIYLAAAGTVTGTTTGLTTLAPGILYVAEWVDGMPYGGAWDISQVSPPSAPVVQSLTAGSVTATSGVITNLTVSGASTYGAASSFSYDPAAVTAQRNALGLGVASDVVFDGLTLGTYGVGSGSRGMRFSKLDGLKMTNTLGNQTVWINPTIGEVIAYSLSVSFIASAGGTKAITISGPNAVISGGIATGSFTVGTFPTSTLYLMAVVTDALSPTAGATVAAGGSAKALVMYNGTDKKVISPL